MGDNGPSPSAYQSAIPPLPPVLSSSGLAPVAGGKRHNTGLEFRGAKQNLLPTLPNKSTTLLCFASALAWLGL